MQAGRGKPGKRDRGKSKEEAQRKQEASVGLEVRERAKGQKVDTVSPPLWQADRPQPSRSQLTMRR